MRIEDLRLEERDGLLERSVRLSWIGGETRMAILVPSRYALPGDDVSPFVPVALMNAMRRAEPLQIDGPVSRRLVDSLVHAQEIISAWNPSLTRVAVRVAAEAPQLERTPGRACFFSRGIDSTYSAAVGRPAGEELTHLVFWADMEVRYGEATRARELELVRETAERIGLELIVASSNVQRSIVGVLNFDDATSALLASVGLSLPGLADAFVMPTTCGYRDMTHQGTHPLLDRLWSSESVDLVHDLCVADRTAKVEWLARERQDLLPLLHTCVKRDGVENCGECGKCLWSMVLLEAFGVLEQATSFPDRIDLDVLRRVRRPALHHLMSWDSMYRVLGPGPRHDEVKRALRAGLRASTRDPVGADRLSIVAHESRWLRALLNGDVVDAPIFPSGVASSEVGPLDPALPPPRDTPPGLLGLVRAVDHDAGRHRYSLGGLPDGQRSGELGSVLAEEPEDGTALRLCCGDAPVLPYAHRRRPAAVARWVLAPLRWPGVSPPGKRLREVARRCPQAATGRPRGPRDGDDAVGWLHRASGPGRLPLWAARHPALDDVLLTTDEHEAGRLGYGKPALLGYLEARAPVTGALGPAEADIPWARLWGRRETAPP